jgi:hypothetical protein
LPGEIKVTAGQPAENHRGRESEIRFEPRRLTNHWPITSTNAHRDGSVADVQRTRLIKSIDLSRIA